MSEGVTDSTTGSSGCYFKGEPEHEKLSNMYIAVKLLAVKTTLCVCVLTATKQSEMTVTSKQPMFNSESFYCSKGLIHVSFRFSQPLSYEIIRLI